MMGIGHRGLGVIVTLFWLAVLVAVIVAIVWWLT